MGRGWNDDLLPTGHCLQTRSAEERTTTSSTTTSVRRHQHELVNRAATPTGRPSGPARRASRRRARPPCCSRRGPDRTPHPDLPTDRPLPAIGVSGELRQGDDPAEFGQFKQGPARNPQAIADPDDREPLATTGLLVLTGHVVRLRPADAEPLARLLDRVHPRLLAMFGQGEPGGTERHRMGHGVMGRVGHRCVDETRRCDRVAVQRSIPG